MKTLEIDTLTSLCGWLIRPTFPTPTRTSQPQSKVKVSISNVYIQIPDLALGDLGPHSGNVRIAQSVAVSTLTSVTLSLWSSRCYQLGCRVDHKYKMCRVNQMAMH